ncbi:MAG: mammalian cell entry protein [Desulfobacterales bacterium CG23_combo_of_CG06-09_8_20_14_all_52_9]|nr:MAG: mammalian cell entry protein [Desulfobacterales bacterium CG23_combo_of_CG06-09_8_20_14_all_52_9]
MSKLTVEAKVGFFVVLGIFILGYMAMKVGKLSFTREGGYDIEVFFDSVSGLSPDVPVEIAGVEVGRVRDISLKDGKARVTLRIKPDVQIKKDAKAVIRTRGILGDKFIALGAGSETAPDIRPGERLLRTEPAMDLDSLMGTLQDVATDIKKLTGSLAQVMGGAEGEATLKEIFGDFKEMVGTLNSTVQENRDNIDLIIANLSDFSKTLKALGGVNTDDVKKIVGNLSQASDRLGTLMDGMNRIVTRVNEGKGSIGRLLGEEEAVDHLNAALTSLREISEKINQGKGTLGKLINDEETVDKINTALTGINDYLLKQETFRTYLDYRGEYLFDHEWAKSYFTLRIQPKEDKYYLVQLVDDPAGKKKVTRITREVDGEIVQEERTELEDELKFSAQIAKRYYNLGLRGGFFESTGGVGVDYYLFNDRFTLSLEAFDFDWKDNPHLKFSANFSPISHIYITAGYDDFINDNGEESFFLGAGIHFADEDIKTLITKIPIPTN